MRGISTRSLVILAALMLFVHFGLPLIADLLFELYHLIKVEAVYSAYGAARYVTANFMFWNGRWIATALVGLIGFAFLWLRAKRRLSKGPAA